MTIRTMAEDWAPRVLSVLRIATGIVLLQTPIQKFFQFPVVRPGPAAFSLIWFAGAIELILAPLLIVGFLTRPVAFILSGHLAFAYWIGHAPRGFFPSVNGGSIAIVYCFVFLYLAFAGGGPWSVDEALRRKGVRLPV